MAKGQGLLSEGVHPVGMTHVASLQFHGEVILSLETLYNVMQRPYAHEVAS
jgi:hypothetical protein